MSGPREAMDGRSDRSRGIHSIPGDKNLGARRRPKTLHKHYSDQEKSCTSEAHTWAATGSTV